jgi:hypothetical protein
MQARAVNHVWQQCASSTHSLLPAAAPIRPLVAGAEFHHAFAVPAWPLRDRRFDVCEGHNTGEALQPCSTDLPLFNTNRVVDGTPSRKLIHR